MDGFREDLDLIMAGKKPKKREAAPPPATTDVSSILDRMRGGESIQESGGRTGIVNPDSGALGEFQVMPGNVRDWTRRHYKQTLTPEQFRTNPEAQRAVFDGEMGDYLRKALARTGGDEDKAIRMAAAAWYGGKGSMGRYDDPTPQYYKGKKYPSFRDYTNGVLGRTKGQKPNKDGFADFLKGLDSIVPAKSATTNGIDDFKKGLDQAAGIGPPPTNPQNAATPPVAVKAPVFNKEGNQVPVIGGEEPVPQTVPRIAPQVRTLEPQQTPINYIPTPAIDTPPQPTAPTLAVRPRVVPATQVDQSAPVAQNQQPAPPQTAVPGLSEEDTIAVLKYKNLPDTPENRAIVQKEASQNADFGKGVEVKATVDAPALRAQNVSQTAPPAVIPPDAVQEIQSPNVKTYKNVQESLDSSAGSYRVDLSKKPAGMNLRDYIFRATFAPVAARYGLSVDDAMRKMQAGQGGLLQQNDAELAAMGDKETAEYIRTHGNNYTVSYSRGLVNWLLGGTPDDPAEPLKKEFSERQTDSSMNAALRDPMQIDPQNQNELDARFRTDDYQREAAKKQDLINRGIDPDLYAKAEEYVRTSPTAGGTQADIDKQYRLLRDAQVSEEGRKQLEDMGAAMRDPSNSYGELTGSFLGTLAENVGDYGAGAARIFSNLTGYGDGAFTNLQKLGNGARIFEANAANPDLIGQINRFAGSGLVEVPKYMALSALPGGAVVGFGVDSGLRSAGQGKNPLEVGKDTAKGMLLGGLFSAAPKIEALAEKGFTRALVNPVFDAGRTAGPDIVLASKLFGTGARIGTIGVGGFTIEKGFGASNADAAKSAILLALTDVLMDGRRFGEMKDLAGKIFRFGNRRTGETVNATVNKDGSVELLNGEVPPAAVDAEFDLSNVKDVTPDADGVYRVAGDGEPVRAKETRKALPEAPQDAAKTETVQPEPPKPSGGEDIVKTLDESDVSVTFKSLTEAGYSPVEAGNLIENEMANRRNADAAPKKTLEVKDAKNPEQTAPESTNDVLPQTKSASSETTVADRNTVADDLNKFDTESRQTGGALEKKAPTNLSRNFRAGTNDATLTFDSEAQRDLYDYYANEKKAMRGGGQRAGDSRVKDLSAMRDDLAKRLNVEPGAIYGIAKQVAEDVKAQMKGVRHLEERKVADNVLTKRFKQTNLAAGENSVAAPATAPTEGANGAENMQNNIPPDVQTAPEPVQAEPVKAPETPKTEPNAPVQAPVEMFKKIDSLAQMPKEERQAALKQMKSDYDGSGFERARRINGNIAEIVRRMEEKGILEKICD
ncbi:MAG: hypothetical protein JSS81_07510 [Acidobacteria bacterium]|nr:hypothetical protein [Acidobacteriota bacterium]